jgi:hypothetical protein
MISVPDGVFMRELLVSDTSGDLGTRARSAGKRWEHAPISAKIHGVLFDGNGHHTFTRCGIRFSYTLLFYGFGASDGLPVRVHLFLYTRYGRVITRRLKKMAIPALGFEKSLYPFHGRNMGMADFPV